MKKIFLITIFSTLAFAKLHIYTTIPVQKTMVEMIAKNKVEVHSFVQNGVDPHTFKPKAKDMMQVAKTMNKLDKDNYRNDSGDLLSAYQIVYERMQNEFKKS